MTKIMLATVLFFAVLPRPAQAQLSQAAGDRWFAAGLAAYGGAAVIDAKTTYDCSKAGLCREANPVLVPLVNAHGVGFAMAAKLAAQAGFGITLVALRRNHREASGWALAGLLAAQVAVDAINYSRLQDARR